MLIDFLDKFKTHNLQLITVNFFILHLYIIMKLWHNVTQNP